MIYIDDMIHNFICRLCDIRNRTIVREFGLAVPVEHSFHNKLKSFLYIDLCDLFVALDRVL